MRLSSTEELMARAQALAKSLLANSPQSISATKRLLAAQNRAWLDAAIVAALEANAESRETADFREGVSAFLEKRKPVWKKVNFSGNGRVAPLRSSTCSARNAVGEFEHFEAGIASHRAHRGR